MEAVDTFPGYFNARIRAKKSQLMSQSDLENLLHKGSLQSVVDALVASPYEDEMAEALSRYEGADAVEDAVSRNLAHTFQRLVRMTGVSEFRHLVEVFLMQWDLIGVKTLLRNCHHGITGQTAADTLSPGPTLTVPLLNEYSQFSDMSDLVNALRGWNFVLCKDLVSALGEYRESGDLAVLEETLDRAYFVKFSRRLHQADDMNSRMLRRLLQMEIDRINLRLLLYPREESMSVEALTERLLPHGTISSNVLREMAASGTPERVIDALRNTIYRELVDEIEPYIAAGRLGALDRQLENYYMDTLRRAALADVFGIGVVMRFAWLKYNEVMNLRLIARAKARNIPAARVQEELVYA